MLFQALERMDAIRDDDKDIAMEDSSKLTRELLEIEADAENRSSHTVSTVGRDEDDVQASARKGCGWTLCLVREKEDLHLRSSHWTIHYILALQKASWGGVRWKCKYNRESNFRTG